MAHASGCAIYNEPAYPTGACDCGASWVLTHAQITAIVDQDYDDEAWECAKQAAGSASIATAENMLKWLERILLIDNEEKTVRLALSGSEMWQVLQQFREELR